MVLTWEYRNAEYDYFKELGNKVVKADKTAVAKTKWEGMDAFVVYAPISNTGMKLVMVYPAAEAYAALNKVLMLNVGIFAMAGSKVS